MPRKETAQLAPRRRFAGLFILCLAATALIAVLGIGVRGLVITHPTLGEDLRMPPTATARTLP